MAFAVMGLSGRGDAHPDDVHDLFDERARIPGRIDRQ
jgi:hypothetical protein